MGKRSRAGDKQIFTAANVVSFVRLCSCPCTCGCSRLQPGRHPRFAAAAASDFIDGQLARRTDMVSKLADPRSGGGSHPHDHRRPRRVPRRPHPPVVIVVVVLRDAYLLIGGRAGFAALPHPRARRLSGKFATTFLFYRLCRRFERAAHPRFGLVDISWLPGFNGEAVSWGIWFIYAAHPVSWRHYLLHRGGGAPWPPS